MPRSIQQNEQMRKVTQAAIVSAAIQLFAEQGFTATSTRSIAKAAGISTGLLYHYFDSKEKLLDAVFIEAMAMINDHLSRPMLANPVGRRLIPLLESIFDLLARESHYWQLFYALRTQPAIMAQLGDQFRAYTAALRECFIGEYLYLGRPDPEIDAYLLYSMVEGTIQQYLLQPDTYPLDAVVNRILSDFSAKDAPGDTA